MTSIRSILSHALQITLPRALRDTSVTVMGGVGHHCGRVGRNSSPRHRGSQYLRANKRKARRAARVRGRG